MIWFTSIHIFLIKYVHTNICLYALVTICILTLTVKHTSCSEGCSCDTCCGGYVPHFYHLSWQCICEHLTSLNIPFYPPPRAHRIKRHFVSHLHVCTTLFKPVQSNRTARNVLYTCSSHCTRTSYQWGGWGRVIRWHKLGAPTSPRTTCSATPGPTCSPTLPHDSPLAYL